MIPGFAQAPERMSAANAPPYFKPPRGVPHSVDLRKSLRAFAPRGLTSAQKKGLKYEDAALSTLVDLWPERLLVQPSLRFRDSEGSKVVYPDAVLLGLEGDFIIFEVKLRHSIDAYFQLERLYRPVLEQLSGCSTVRCCEVVKDYDPRVVWPDDVKVLFEASSFTQWCKEPEGLAVYRLRP